jgi:signal transduction histidine kinase
MRFPDFQPCLFVVSSDGRILSYEPHFLEWLGNHTDSLANVPFRKVMGQINPDWLPQIPGDPADIPSGFYLPWEKSGQGADHYGIQIQKVSHGNLHFLTLLMDISSAWQLYQKTHSLTSEATLRAMTLRALNAEARMETYMANFPGIFFSQRPDLSFSYIGQGVTELLSHNPDHFYKNSGMFLNMIDPEDRERFIDTLRNNASTPNRFSQSFRIRKPESSDVIYLLDVRTPKLTPSGILIGYDGVWLDVTRQAIAENRLSSTVWKENLTHLTNGLAHDFGNLMAGIYSVSDLHLRNLEKEDSMFDLLGNIKHSSLQAQQLVRKILDLHKDQDSGDKTYHDLRTLLQEQLDLCQILVARSTSIELQVPEHALPVHIDESAFRQTILNLTINSRDAMGSKGAIQIRLREIKSSQEMAPAGAPIMGPAPQDGVIMDFSDSGTGIPPDVIGKIFQPFFSTKPNGKGSGFGLYNARIFATNHRGKIGVTSIPGEGTTFHLYLPLVKE